MPHPDAGQLIVAAWLMLSLPVALLTGRLLARNSARYPAVGIPSQRRAGSAEAAPGGSHLRLVPCGPQAPSGHRPRSVRRTLAIGATCLVAVSTSVGSAAALGSLPGPAQAATASVIEALSPFTLPRNDSQVASGPDSSTARQRSAAAASPPSARRPGATKTAAPVLPKDATRPPGPEALTPVGPSAPVPAPALDAPPTFSPDPSAFSEPSPTDAPVVPTTDPASPTPDPASPTPDPVVPTTDPASPTPDPASPTPDPASPTPEASSPSTEVASSSPAAP